MELKQHLEILQRRWRSALIVALVIIGLGALGGLLISPKYEAETTLRMVTPLGGSTGGTNYETAFATRLINTYAQIATSERVMNELKEKLGVNDLPDISVNIIPDSEIIQVKVEGNDPALAAKTANALAEMLVAYRDEAVSSADSSELNLLAERKATLQEELAKYQQEHNQLVQAYSQTIADMDVLDRTIKLKEGTYQSLSNQYELTVVDVAVLSSGTSTAQRDALAKEMDRIGKELDSLNQQFKDLSIKSNEYMQGIDLLGLSIQSTQNAYSNLLDRYDAALLAHLRQENAQNMITVSPAFEPSRPSSPGGLFIFGLAVIMGVIAGIVAAFAIDYLDPRIYSLEQIQRLTSAPVIASISKFQAPQVGDLPDHNDLAIQRDYWILRARLQALIQESSAKTILVTSPKKMEGKSVITYTLASGLAQNNYKVLVVDADLRTPKQHKLFDVTGEQGLGDFLGSENTPLKDMILKNVKPGVDLLPSLTEYESPIELLQSRSLNTLFESLQGYDLVFFDSPALLVFPDALALSKSVDGVVIVTQCGHDTSEDFRSACSQLENVGSRILGTVVNQMEIRKDSDLSPSGIKQWFRHVKETISFLFRARNTPKPASSGSRGSLGE